MPRYVDTNLSRNEEIVFRAKISWLSALVPLLLGAILLPLFGVGLVIIVPVVISRLTTELALTNQRIISKMGFISRQTVELRNEKIESIEVSQSVLGRILGYGSVSARGTGGTATLIPYIKDPLKFRRVVNNYLETKEIE